MKKMRWRWIDCVLLMAFLPLAGCQTISAPHIRNEVASKAERDLIRAVRNALPVLREASERIGWCEVNPRWAYDGPVFHDPALRLEAQKAAEEQYLDNLRDIEGYVREIVHDRGLESKEIGTGENPERWRTDDSNTELE